VAATVRPAANDNVLRRSRNRWRVGTLAAALAAALFGAIVVQDTPGGITNIGPKIAGVFTGGDDPYTPAPLGGRQFVAVVNAEGGASPSLVVSVDGATREVKVRSLGITRPEGKSLEVWYVPEGEKAISVGLLGEGKIDLKELDAKGGDLFAISLEPPGGSPTGTATGPVIYSGKLVEEPTE
ncbi:MAG: anti-sigma factor, partial [Pseudomonadota bacterium]